MESLRKSVMEMGEPRQLVLPPCPNCGDNRVVMARQVRKEDMEANPVFAEFLRQQQAVLQQRQQQQQQQRQRMMAMRRHHSRSCECDSVGGGGGGGGADSQVGRSLVGYRPDLESDNVACTL